MRRAFEVEDSIDPELKKNAHVKIKKDKVLVSGDAAFYTLQGEGPTIGLPCVFIRLHVCNLQCTWCDAFYTWSPSSKEFWTEGRYLDFEECAQLIRDTWGVMPDGTKVDTPGQKRVIWTGGEPLIQRKQIDCVMTELWDGYSSYHRSSWAAEFETNGTLMPTEKQLQYAQFNCSPKLRNSENREGAMVKPKVLRALNEANTTFKFVCMDEKDLDEIEEKYLPHIDHSKVVIMPQGITEEEVSHYAKDLAEPCKQRGYRLLPRLQNILWDGARRGV